MLRLTEKQKRVDLAYNAAGEFTSIDRYEDLGATLLVATTTYGYDQGGRLTDLTHAKDSNTLADYDWQYDSAGRVTEFTSPDGTSTYNYDETGQLTGATHSFQTDESYSYDENGNRTNDGYTTGTNNQLLSDGTWDYEYDAEGNRTKKTHIADGKRGRVRLGPPQPPDGSHVQGFLRHRHQASGVLLRRLRPPDWQAGRRRRRRRRHL